MAVNRACYATRADVMSAPDIKFTADMLRHVDSAIEAAADEVDKLTNRRFWNSLDTVLYDWPNFQRAYPWRIWFDAAELADVTGTPPVVTTGGTSIPDSAIFWGPWNYAPPYTFMELDRSQSYSFGVGSTPQRDVSITALRGYWNKTRPAGTLSAALSSTTATSATVSDSADVGVGDVIIVDSESMLVRDAAMADTGQAQQGSGCTTLSAADNQLTVTDGTKYTAGEVLQLDAEWMLALSITGNVITVVRGFGGTVLAAHSGAEVYAQRLLTVSRGFGNSTAATHLSTAAVNAQLIPSDARELAIAEALNFIYQKTSGYARTVGEGQALVPGGSLPDLRSRVYNSLGRKARSRVV
jgi:hypothetical protein